VDQKQSTAGSPDQSELERDNKARISEWWERRDLAELAYAPSEKLRDYRQRGSNAPPALPTFVGSLGALGNAFIGALQVYWWYIERGLIYGVGKAPAQWDEFERGLGRLFACLLMTLADCQGEAERRKLLSLILLESLKLKNWRGRPRKEAHDLSDMVHGRNMDSLWENELQEVWNAKASLEGAGRNPRHHLEKKFEQKIVQAVLARKATPESSLAWLYSRQEHISEGRARNALRAYQVRTKRKFAPHV
jgi:hypothetical protein